MTSWLPVAIIRPTIKSQSHELLGCMTLRQAIALKKLLHLHNGRAATSIELRQHVWRHTLRSPTNDLKVRVLLVAGKMGKHRLAWIQCLLLQLLHNLLHLRRRFVTR